MKSSIKIEFADKRDGKGLQPFIKIKSVYTSDDTRDKLLEAFLNKLYNKDGVKESKWLVLALDGNGGSESGDCYDEFSLYPVTPEELSDLKHDVDLVVEGTHLPVMEGKFGVSCDYTKINLNPDYLGTITIPAGGSISSANIPMTNVSSEVNADRITGLRSHTTDSNTVIFNSDIVVKGNILKG